jgi:phosphatidylserine/phosphatidylglycerophosphate/cardiolipin synthase-like enzyme
MVRGKDHRAGADGSPEQEALLAELRAVGLQEEDLNFWQQNALTVQNVLGYAVRKGVDVKVLIWKGSSLFSHCDVEAAEKELKRVDVQCILDDSAFGILHHPIESLHQKIAIVDGSHAFAGGIDLVIENEDDFDRWDTPGHPLNTPLRRRSDGTPSHPWHDVHAIIDGPAAADVELNFRQRWNDVVQRKRIDESLLVPEHIAAPPVETSTVMQIARTIPQHTYSFGLPPDNSIRGIAQLYSNALSNIQRFVYLENQYLWLRAYIGIDIPFTSYESADMAHNIQALIAALKRGAAMSIILPDHPNVGRAFSDAGLMKIRQEAPEAVEQGRFAAFTLASCAIQSDSTHYRPIYVHAKVAIIDDIWTTVGSANLNNRGMRDDTELNLATLDPQLAHGLRLMLQAEHLGLVSEDELVDLLRLLGRLHQTPSEQERAANTLKKLHETLADPLTALHLMHDRAQENLSRYKANQLLHGYLLPYLTAEEATAQGLHFQEEHGWIEKA